MANKDLIPRKIVIPIIVAAIFVIAMVMGYSQKRHGSSETKTSTEVPQTSDDWFTDLVQPHPAGHIHDAITETGVTGKPKSIFICPMNCVPPMKQPGQCPVCGMDLVEVSAPDNVENEEAPAVTFSKQALKAAGATVAPATRQAVSTEIRLFGKIEYDPVEQYKVTAFAPGIIDRIYVKRAGQTVRRGDPLFDMHSSELYFLEQELSEVLKQFPDDVDYRPARGQIYKRQMRPPPKELSPSQAGRGASG